MKDFIQKEIIRIRHLVGDRAQVIGAVSGGVDSTVAAKLMKEAIGTATKICFYFPKSLTRMQATVSTPFSLTTVSEPLKSPDITGKIADRLYSGVMRLNECEQVKETLEKHLGINLTVVDGADLFLGRLKGVAEPEKKRKIIGATCTFLVMRRQNAVNTLTWTSYRSLPEGSAQNRKGCREHTKRRSG